MDKLQFLVLIMFISQLHVILAVCLLDPTFSHFSTALELRLVMDRRTDGRTDTRRLHTPH